MTAVMKATTSYVAPAADERTSPWASKGQDVSGLTDLDAILKAAGLDFEVEAAIPVVGGTPQPEFRAVRRLDTGKVFGFAKKGYQTVQNRQALSLLQDLLETQEVDVATAGTAKGGARVWIQAKLHRGLDIHGDLFRPYLTIATSHDGSMGVKAILGSLRLSCTNQFPILGAGGATWSHRHSTHVLTKADDARRILGLAAERLDAFEVEVARLMDQEVTDRRFRQIVATMLPMSDEQTPRQRENVEAHRGAVAAMYASEADGGLWTGTGWGVVNAFNSYAQWAKPVKSTSERAERQIVRTLDGTFGAMTEKVAALVLN